LVDNRKVLAEMPKDIMEKLENRGVRYTIYYEHRDNAIYNCWQGNIHEDKALVEEYLSTLEYEWEWVPGKNGKEGLRYWKEFPVTVEHPETDEVCFFNQIVAHHKTFYKAHPKYASIELNSDFDKWPVHTTYADGSEIEPETLERMRNIVWRNAVGVDLEPGDVVVVDNYTVQHGRMPFEGERKVFVSPVYD